MCFIGGVVKNKPKKWHINEYHENKILEKEIHTLFLLLFKLFLLFTQFSCTCNLKKGGRSVKYQIKILKFSFSSTNTNAPHIM